MRTQTIEVYEGIKKGIIDGTYQPAESLTELELAQHYGVSRNTVKKVLLMLEKENLVIIEQNKSAKVRVLSPAEVLEYLEVREVLEGLAIRLAAPSIPEEAIHAMDSLLTQMEEHVAVNQLFEYSRCNHEFHATIYNSCRNEKAVDMIVSLKNQLRKYNFKTILVPGRNQQSMDEHRAILHALKLRDVGLAEMLMRRHVASVRATFEENHALLR